MTRRETIARWFPAPLAALALLLVVLILLTPVLYSNGQPVAGSLLTQAELIVDRVAGSDVTHFYVRAVGTTVRYSDLSIEVASNFSWTGAFPAGPLNWTSGANGTNLLTILWSTTLNPVVLNVSAFYQANGGSALYLGEVAFDYAAAPGTGLETLYATTSTPGLTIDSPPPTLANLPATILLVDVGSGP